MQSLLHSANFSKDGDIRRVQRTILSFSVGFYRGSGKARGSNNFSWLSAVLLLDIPFPQSLPPAMNHRNAASPALTQAPSVSLPHCEFLHKPFPWLRVSLPVGSISQEGHRVEGGYCFHSEHWNMLIMLGGKRGDGSFHLGGTSWANSL